MKFNHTPIKNGGIMYYHKNASKTLDAYFAINNNNILITLVLFDKYYF